MENNRSLAVSAILNQELKKGIMLGLMDKHIPDEIFEIETTVKSRDRIFSPRATLETMLLSSTLEDKTLGNAVSQYYTIHQKKRKILAEEIKQETEKQKQEYKSKANLRGRPPKFEINLPKSKETDISLNTAAYSKARKRLPVRLTRSLFESTQITTFKNDYSHWHGLIVLVADGSYLQLQDTPEIRKAFPIKDNSGSYPQALLETLIVRGSGQLFDFKLASRSVSELTLFSELLESVPKGHLVLMDDLYNSYEILNKCIVRGIHFVVPAKRKRNYTVKQIYGKGDEIMKSSSRKQGVD